MIDRRRTRLAAVSLALAAWLATLGGAEAAPGVRYRAKGWVLRTLNGGTAPEILSIRMPPAKGDWLSPLPLVAPRTRFRRFVYERKGTLRGLRRAILGGSATKLELDGRGFVQQLKKGAVYNLIMMGDELLLAETGPSFFRDVVSRHAVLSDYQQAEFAATVQRMEDDTLELANWSGTFMTPAARLQVAADRMREGLGIEKIRVRPVDKKGVLSAAPSPAQ